MKDKERDKRLFLPEDEFGEEASEGLGKLSREEAEADLRELKGRLRKRVSRPRHIWMQAAAALVVLLIASTVVIYIFRDKGIAENNMAKADTAVKDTALIALAQPVKKEASAPVTDQKRVKYTAPVIVDEEEFAAREKAAGTTDLNTVMAEAEEDTDMVMEMAVAADEGAVPEEVVVEAMPMMQKAAMTEQAAAKRRTADKTAGEQVADKAAAQPVSSMPDRQAAPVGGWEEFNRWTRPNTSLPGDVKPEVSRAVVVAFRVRADSTLYDLKAIRTAGDSYTQEALRLLREGPLWVPAMLAGVVIDKEVMVTIIFK